MTLPTAAVPLRHPEKAARPDHPSPRKPPWIRVKAPGSPEYHATRRLMRELNLNTVCEEAACPNIGECWKEKHATVMILGRGLHPRLHLLQCRDRPARPGRPARARAGRRCGRRARPQAHRRHLGRPRRSRRRRRRPFRADDRRDPRRRARHDDRGAGPRFPAQGRRDRDRDRGPARRPQPQSRNRAAALRRSAAGRALFPFAAPARPGKADRPGDVHEIGDHGRARRGEGRGACR